MDISICERMCPFLKGCGDKIRCHHVYVDQIRGDELNFTIHHNILDDTLEAGIWRGNHYCCGCLTAPIEKSDGTRIMEEIYRYGKWYNLIRDFFNFERHGRRCPIYAERLLEEWRKK